MRSSVTALRWHWCYPYNQHAAPRAQLAGSRWHYFPRWAISFITMQTCVSHHTAPADRETSLFHSFAAISNADECGDAYQLNSSLFSTMRRLPDYQGVSSCCGLRFQTASRKLRGAFAGIREKVKSATVSDTQRLSGLRQAVQMNKIRTPPPPYGYENRRYFALI